MALRAAAHMILVAPSLVNDNETERDNRLVVITHTAEPRKVHRGVVEDVGAHVAEEIEPGNVAFYTEFVEIQDKHAVPANALMAFDR